VARTIHEESRRAAKTFRVIECAAVPPALLEAELFGARAGAFTHLASDRPGILALAAGGTVLLDEVAGAPLEAQAKLLRVLSEGMVRPLGAEEEARIDVRFLFSTSRDLEREAAEGRLRRDILHRIRIVTVDLPPLRERPEDLRHIHISSPHRSSARRVPSRVASIQASLPFAPVPATLSVQRPRVERRGR
jgi:DNA-binding NtrC family response regulator